MSQFNTQNKKAVLTDGDSAAAANIVSSAVKKAQKPTRYITRPTKDLGSSLSKFFGKSPSSEYQQPVADNSEEIKARVAVDRVAASYVDKSNPIYGVGSNADMQSVMQRDTYLYRDQYQAFLQVEYPLIPTKFDVQPIVVTFNDAGAMTINGSAANAESVWTDMPKFAVLSRTYVHLGWHMKVRALDQLKVDPSVTVYAGVGSNLMIQFRCMASTKTSFPVSVVSAAYDRLDGITGAVTQSPAPSHAYVAELESSVIKTGLVAFPYKTDVEAEAFLLGLNGNNAYITLTPIVLNKDVYSALVATLSTGDGRLAATLLNLY